MRSEIEGEFEPSAYKLATCQDYSDDHILDHQLHHRKRKLLHEPLNTMCERGRIHGVKSEEVRIMQRMFGREVSPKHCVTALDIVNWNTHHAIKLVRLQNLLQFTVEAPVESCKCKDALETWNWDEGRAAVSVLNEIQTKAKT